MSKNLSLEEKREALGAEYTPTGSTLLLDDDIAVVIDALAVAMNLLSRYMSYEDAAKLVGEKRKQILEDFKNGKK